MKSTNKRLDLVRVSFVISAALLQTACAFLPQIAGWQYSIAERADEKQTLLIPAGWAFSIWGLLYLGSIIFAIWQAQPSRRRDRLLRNIGWWAGGCYLGNALWILYTPRFGSDVFSTLFLLAISASILVACFKIRAYASQNTLVFIPLFALAGWLTLASGIAISQTLQYDILHSSAVTPLALAYGLLLVWYIAISPLAWQLRSWPYAAPIAWGLFGTFWVNMARGEHGLATVSATMAMSLLIITFVAKRRSASGSVDRAHA